MDIASIRAAITELVNNSPANRVQEQDAIRPELVGMQLYQPPLLGVADAADPLFAELREASVVGPQSWLPQQWLDGAASVLSLFFPLAALPVESNARDWTAPSPEWLHARIEGEIFSGLAAAAVAQIIEAAGGRAVIPLTDARFVRYPGFTSNWSERHVAYIAGLGSFGMSRGLITERGMAGRLISVITDLPFPATPRPYDSPFAYCSSCGACARHCPAQAIDPARGVAAAKDQQRCSDFLDSTRQKRANGRDYYGCGKCQVKTPCSTRIPGASKQ